MKRLGGTAGQALLPPLQFRRKSEAARAIPDAQFAVIVALALIESPLYDIYSHSKEVIQ